MTSRRVARETVGVRPGIAHAWRACLVAAALVMGAFATAPSDTSSAPSESAPPAAETPPAPSKPATPPAETPAAPAKPSAPSSPAAPTTPPTPDSGVPKQQGVHEVVLKDLDGKDVPLSKFAGKPMVIELWATWCGPCIRQRELMNKLAPEFKDRVAFIAASVDKEGAPKVKEHLKGKPVSKELLDLLATPALRQLIAKRDKSPTIPKVIYVDSRGRITDISSSVQNEAWMRAMLKNLR